MNQKGSAGIIAAIIFIIVVIVILVIPKGKTIYETPYDPLAKILPSPSLLPTPNYSYINTVEDALKKPEESKKLQFCGQKLNEVSPKAGELVKTQHLDFSNNNLSKLPPEISKLSRASLTELALVGNNFSKDEQTKIRKLLPYIKIAFTPQKNFDPYFNDTWETYDSKKYGFSFRYHPELLIKERDGGLSIENEFASMNENAFSSCAIETGYIKMSVSVEDNPENLTPIQYLEKLWEFQATLQGDTYVVPESKRMERMIGEIKKYKNGDLDGIIADAGESEHPRIITTYNGKIYSFQYLPGGETGSRIPKIAKEVLNQTLATFKYLN